VTTSEPSGSVPGTSGTSGTGGSFGPEDPLSTTPRTPAPATGGAIGTARPAPSTARRRARTTGRTLALALLIFVTVVLVLFVVFNTQTVDVSLVFGNVRLALVVALLLAAVLGGLLVMLATFVVRAKAKPRD
jgi:uncharacterized integral membrane protein